MFVFQFNEMHNLIQTLPSYSACIRNFPFQVSTKSFNTTPTYGLSEGRVKNST